MAQTINTNVMSLNAQRNLNANNTSLATTIQRLSSGLRINSAKDDAAGLAISQRMTTQINGLTVAVRNANDGISLAQTAEGAMEEIGNNLQRIRELAVQAANATNSSTDRAALQSEVTQLASEIDRIAKQADFNGTKLLDGSFTSQLFQVGANAGEAIAIDKVVDAKTASLGNVKYAQAVSGASAFADGDATTGLMAASGTVSGMVINGVQIPAITWTAGTPSETVAGQLTSAINAKFNETGVYATASESNNDYTLKLESLLAGKDLDVSSGAAGIASGVTAASGGTAQFIDNVSVSSFQGAQQALGIIDSALSAISSARADMGAIQNRFTSVIANLSTNSENLSASRGRIIDADYAAETAELTRTQILQQAGTAMLAQANTIPQSVLKLLGQ